MANFATQISFTKTFSIVSNISVILGLIFLVIELRQNNDFMSQNAEFMRSQSTYNYYSQRSNFTREGITSGMSELFAKLLSGQEPTTSETIKLNFYMRSLYELWEYEFYELKNGHITAEQHNATEKINVIRTLMPYSLSVFNGYLPSSPTEFREFWESTLRENNL